jgi:hypothetical protein
MESSILSEVDDTSILRTGLSSPLWPSSQPATGLSSLAPRSGLERSDFVRWYRPDTYREQAKQGVVANPVGPPSSFDPDEPLSPKHVIRGGSYLCSEAFCFSYRPAARMKMSADSALPNVGLRLVKPS